jgi:hypothetical protein
MEQYGTEDNEKSHGWFVKDFGGWLSFTFIFHIVKRYLKYHPTNTEEVASIIHLVMTSDLKGTLQNKNATSFNFLMTGLTQYIVAALMTTEGITL